MTIANKENSFQEITGLVPAGGLAARLAPLPCSKELYPIGFRDMPQAGTGLRPKAVCHYLLESIGLAGITKVYIVLRQGKWDIPAYLRDGAMLDMHLAYLIMNLPYGAPYTIDQAYPFVKDSLVAFGFPDIIFQPVDAFEQLLKQQFETNADVVLGLFPTDQPHKADMVDVRDDGSIREIVIKPAETQLRFAWINAVWSSHFTRFMHEFLAQEDIRHTQEFNNQALQPKHELFVGNVIQAAIDAGLRVEAVCFPEGYYLDIGTPDDLIKAVSDNLVQAT